MIIGQLTDGARVGHGVTVQRIRRIRDGYSVITLSTGRTLTVHKSTHVADLMIGHMPAESLMPSTIRTLREPRVSAREWRGENVGQRGERFIARNSGHDSRALAERLSRQGR